MPLISSALMLRGLSLAHLAFGYALLFRPKFITDVSVVFILGEAMKLPPASGLEHPSAASALAGTFLILLSISDFLSIGSSKFAQQYWSMQAPVRLLFFFILTATSYLRSGPVQHSFLSSSSVKGTANAAAAGLAAGQGQGVSNNVLFTWSFLELITWFSIFNTLREEKRITLVDEAKKERERIERENE